MYVVFLLKNGKKKEIGRYDSPSDFRYEYPKVSYIIVGYVIYTNDIGED